MGKLFSTRNDGIKLFDAGTGDVVIGDITQFTASEIGNGNYLFDPKTGKTWSSDGSTFTDETPVPLPNDPNVEGAILRWDDTGNEWVTETDLTVSSAGNLATSGTITSTNSTVSNDENSGAIVTDGGIGAAGNINAGGNLAAVGSVTGGAGVTATTGGLTATAGGLTVTAGTTDINDVINISGAVTLDNAAANSLAMSGTTNVIDLNGTAAQSIEMAGTTNLIDLAGTGAHEIQMGGTTNTIDLNGTGAQAIEMAGTTNIINLGGSGNAEISFTASGTKKISGLDTPSSANDAANKAYVDAVASGLSVKSPARVATTAALPGSPTYNNGTGGVGATLTSTGGGTSLNTLGIDGVTNLAVNDEILVKNQSTQAHNGKYIVTTVGVDSSVEYVLTRVTPYDEASEITDGSFFFVKEGTANGDKGFVQTQAVTTIGTDNIIFQQFSSAGGGVTNVSAESGSATPSGGSITITGSPSIDTSATGSTVTVALAADLTSGAAGFTVADTRIPYATAVNTLGSGTGLSFDDGAAHILSVANTSQGGIILGVSSVGVLATQGTSEPFNGTLLATGTNSKTMLVRSGKTSGTGISGIVSIESGDTSGSGASGIAQIKSGNASGTGDTGSVVISSGEATGGGDSGSVTIKTETGVNTGAITIITDNTASGDSGNITIQTGTASGTRGTVTINAAADGTVLTNSPTDATTTAATTAIATVEYVRDYVVRRESVTAAASPLAMTALDNSATFSVSVKNGSGSYSSVIQATSYGTSSTADSTEYAIVFHGTAPAPTIAVDGNSGNPRITVTSAGNDISIVEIPFAY